MAKNRSSSALELIITDAGIKAAVDADHNGLSVELTEIAIGRGMWEPDKTATVLQDEIKRIKDFGASELSLSTLHATITDDSSDSYVLGEFGLYTSTGVLFAIYSQETAISEKISSSVFMLSIDIKLDSVPPKSVTITGNNFNYPPATPEKLGVIVDAPHDGNNYVRNNGKWILVPPQDTGWRSGDIKMYAGSVDDIQDGWQLCNGEGETTTGIKIPDLRDRMIVCCGETYTTGDKGGSANAKTTETTLSTSQIPSHYHYTDGNRSGNKHVVAAHGDGTFDCRSVYYSYDDGTYTSLSKTGYEGSSHGHSHSVNTMPPYFALAFIIKL